MKDLIIKNLPLFTLGFRPFFLLAGLSALLLISGWSLIYQGYWSSGQYYSTVYWHAHEMLLGYTTAVLAGFFLTAVRNWTGLPTPSGYKLAGLCLLWLSGRILPFFVAYIPKELIASTDLLFVPTLIYVVTTPIITAKQNRNLIFSGLLLLLFLGNSLVHSQILDLTEATAHPGFQLIIGSIVTIILVIAGRIFPFFTERGLPGTVVTRKAKLDFYAVISAIAVFVLSAFNVLQHLLALTSLVALLLNSVRIYGWYSVNIWRVPLLWVLYTGYGWIIIGFALTTLSAYGLIQSTLPLHAFTVGGIGVLTLGMMARVALGHTGRQLVVSNCIVAAFWLINLSALIRVLLPTIFPEIYMVIIGVASIAWLTAFALFLLKYVPILLSARVDGKDI